MGKDSTIEWTHHTFNPWWGCVKVSEGCKHCYAETWAKRVGSNVWGPKASRRFFSDRHWDEPLRWDREALLQKERRRVFCASMADVFEPRSELDPWRDRLWHLIAATRNLDWLLLTKRPEHIATLAPWSHKWPPNVWLGVTAENQDRANERVRLLLQYPAAVRFLSCEPLLGPIDLSQSIRGKAVAKPFRGPKAGPGIHWVIAGGESGPGARPMHPAWPRSLREQCISEGIAFHFKQWGHWAPSKNYPHETAPTVRLVAESGDSSILVRIGKKRAGRLLDGRTWDGMPSLEINAPNSRR